MRDEIGKFIPSGVAVGIEANADEVYDQMDALRQNVAQPFDVSVIGRNDLSGIGAYQGYNDSKVIEAIEGLQEYIAGITVRLSSGELVGALTPNIDMALGRTQILKARGG